MKSHMKKEENRFINSAGVAAGHVKMWSQPGAEFELQAPYKIHE
jgi:hypothetical protein